MWGDNEFNSTFSSPNANANKEAKKILPKHIVPVTAHVINQCQHVENESSIFEYNQLKFNQICFVGIIRNVIKRANDITYLVDDMTSSEVQVKLQAEDQDDMETEENRPPQMQFIENQYVRVNGIIKSLGGQKNVQAFNIRPLKDLNELTHHMLECINASIYYTQKASGEGLDMHANPSVTKTTFNNQESSSGGLTGIHLQISNMIKQCKTNEGVHLSEVYAAFSNMPQNKIKEAVDFLSTEGHVYSTTDDEHFRSTDSY